MFLTILDVTYFPLKKKHKQKIKTTNIKNKTQNKQKTTNTKLKTTNQRKSSHYMKCRLAYTRDDTQFESFTAYEKANTSLINRFGY